MGKAATENDGVSGRTTNLLFSYDFFKKKASHLRKTLLKCAPLLSSDTRSDSSIYRGVAKR